MDPVSVEPRQRPRGPGVLYSVVVVVLVALVGALTFQAQQPPPPTIAVFSPQAVERIEDAPDEQSSQFGSGEGGEIGTGGAGVATPPPPDELPINVPRTHRCVGDPPRQIEDPQSPPCVPFWEGENGGATYRGVTENEIRVAVPLWDANIHPPLQNFFNSRFEFYGRKLLLIDGENPMGNPEDERADAIANDQLVIFASTAITGGGYWYYVELAERKTLSTVSFSQGMTDELGSRWRPYMWVYQMAYNRQFANIGEWTCKRLAGRDAVHAGDPALHDDTRKFGLFLTRRYIDTPLRSEWVERELNRCGAELEVDQEMTYEESAGAGFTPEDAANAIIEMKAKGVTSVYCLCVHVQLGHAMRAASSQEFYPEWLLSSYEDIDNSEATRGFAADAEDQRANAFGTTFRPRHVLAENHPATWAMREGGSGATPSTFQQLYLYPDILLLASGIQMAGPKLTPETFEQGLHRTVFPNPDHPIMFGDVGFEDRDYTMTDDGAEIWWSNTAVGHDGLERAYCYVDGGARRAKGAWPQGGDPFFKEPCDTSDAG